MNHDSLLKSLSPIHLVKIRLSNFLGNEFRGKCTNLNEITPSKLLLFQR